MSTPSLANKLRAVAGFIKILLTPAPDLSAYDTAQHQPLLRAPEYGIDNAAWRETHDVTGAFSTTSAHEDGHIRVPSRQPTSPTWCQGSSPIPRTTSVSDTSSRDRATSRSQKWRA